MYKIITMAAKAQANTVSNSYHSFEGVEKFSAYQPIDIKPLYGRKWVTNGLNNANFKTYKDAYDDSPTNSSIINAFVNYVYGEGMIDKAGKEYCYINVKSIISQEDILLICQDYKTYGGYAAQVIWNAAIRPTDRKPLKIEYMPIYKLGVNYDGENKVDGYWYSYDWGNRGRYQPKLYPKFSGKDNGNNLEILYVRRPTAEPFFPIPDYLSGLFWASVEGELANSALHHYKNAIEDITVINYNNGRLSDAVAKIEAEKVRNNVVGTNNRSRVIVSFNEESDEAVVVDRISPPELNQQNVFYAEEAERKLIVAHSAPPVLFSGSNSGSGFSSNADEIAVATKGLYRRHINPMREIILNGLQSVFDLINNEIVLDFKDFKEETELENTAEAPVNKETAQAQAQLKGSVGGVQSLLEVQASYAQGTTTYESAIAILDLIFGFNREQAIRLLGNPQTV